MLRLEGKYRPSGEATWRTGWDFYQNQRAGRELLPRLAQAEALIDDTAPKLANTPAGAFLIEKAPGILRCIYPGTTALFHHVLVTRVEDNGARSVVSGFVRMKYPNGWIAEQELTITSDAESGQTRLEIGRTTTDDPRNANCSL